MTTQRTTSRSSTAAVPDVWATSARPLLVAGLAVLCAGVLVAGPHVAAVIAGLLLAFVLPGVATLDALLPARAVPWTQRIVLTPALSVAVVVLGGLALHVARVPLHQTAWCTLTTGVAVVMSAVGLVRALRTTHPRTAAARMGRAGLRVTPARALTRLAPLVLAAVLLVGAGWFSLRSAQQQPAPPFTALQMVPAGAAQLTPGERTVTVGLRCEEAGLTDYEIRLTGASRFRSTLKVRLWPGGTWAQQVKVPAAGRTTAQLYRVGDKDAYRTVFLEGTR
jgi:uncharacterized membrane protein